MADLSWLSNEAKQVHAVFLSMFYSFATVLLLLGVVTEYFKLPLGGLPQISQLVGRTIVAAILLTTYSEVSNAVADFADALAKDLGSLNEIKHVLSKMGDKLGELSWSWTSIKDSLILLLSFLTFFVLYISVYIADAAIIYAWALLFVFSPLLIVLYILPVTSGATKTLYRSLFEVSAWKIVWSVLATLLWSSALSQMNHEGAQINFITSISFNLILAASLLLTPLVVNALTSKGIANLASSMTGLAASAAFLAPGGFAKKAGGKLKGSAVEGLRSSASGIKEKYFAGNKTSTMKEKPFPVGDAKLGAQSKIIKAPSSKPEANPQQSFQFSARTKPKNQTPPKK